MGYNVDIRGSDFRMKRDHRTEEQLNFVTPKLVEEILERIDETYHRQRVEELKKVTSFDELIDVVFDDPEYFNVQEDGEVELCHHGRMGIIEEFFRALAPFVQAGSLIEWTGDDGELYAWKFNGSLMSEYTGYVSYPETNPNAPQCVIFPAGRRGGMVGVSRAHIVTPEGKKLCDDVSIDAATFHRLISPNKLGQYETKLCQKCANKVK